MKQRDSKMHKHASRILIYLLLCPVGTFLWREKDSLLQRMPARKSAVPHHLKKAETPFLTTGSRTTSVPWFIMILWILWAELLTPMSVGIGCWDLCNRKSKFSLLVWKWEQPGKCSDPCLIVLALPSKVVLVCLPGPWALVLSLTGKEVRKLTSWLRFF